MTRLADTVLLGPADEAVRLWQGALAEFSRAADDLVALCGCLDLGIRAAEILLFQRLLPVKGRFPATIGLQLEVPVADVDVHRDAVAEPHALQFTELLDLVSAEDLVCVGPRLHRGWEDRASSCTGSRVTARGATGVELQKAERDDLLLLAACRNRIFRYPPPLRLEPPRLLAAFPTLARLVERVQRR